jgi:hypothetical protein
LHFFSLLIGPEAEQRVWLLYIVAGRVDARKIADRTFSTSYNLTLSMTSFSETALSVLSSPRTTCPKRHSRSLPDVVQRILPHTRYSSFLEILAAGSRAFEAPTRATPPLPLPVQDKDLSKDLAAHTRGLHKEIGRPGREPHIPPSRLDDIVFCILYKTHGKFAWMNGRTIEDVKTMKWLGGWCHFPAVYVRFR